MAVRPHSSLLSQTRRCKSFIDGEAVSEEAFLRYELARARTALAMLKQKLDAKGMQELLAEDCATMDAEERTQVAQSNGQWVGSTAEIEVTGASAEAFLAWFYERSGAGDHATMLAAHPEHYVIAAAGDRRLDVIETTGSWRLPTRFFAELGQDPAGIAPSASAVDPSCTHFMAGRFFLADGTELGRPLHQFRNTETGFRATLTIYFASASPPEKIDGHKWHLAIEFTNWVNLFFEERDRAED